MKRNNYSIQACRFTAILISLLTLTASCGTTNSDEYTIKEPLTYNLKNTDNNGCFNAKIYTVKDDELTSFTSDIELYGNLSPLEALLQSLLSNDLLSKYIECEYKLLSVDLSFDVCIINLDGELPTDIKKWFALESVITSTLNSFGNINSVCILLNGAVPAYKGLPLGAAVYSTIDLHEYVSRRFDVFNDDSDTHRNTVLSNIVSIFPISQEKWIKAETKSDKLFSRAYSKKEQIDILLQSYSQEFTRYHNKYSEHSVDDCFTWNIKTAGDHISIAFKYQNDVIDPDIFIHCIALTLTCNIDDISNVKLSVNNKKFNFDPDASRGMLGTSISVYYPMRDDSTLEKKELILPSESAYDPQQVLEFMLMRSSTSDTLFPNYLSGRVTVCGYSDNVVKILLPNDVYEEILNNFILSEEHYYSNETRERLFIYSIVNTLTQLPSVKQVLFLSDSETVCKPFLNIYLGMPLYANPGLDANKQ